MIGQDTNFDQPKNSNDFFFFNLFAASIYILFYTTLMELRPRTITSHNITPVLFNQLYHDHAEALLCPCSTIAVPFKEFVVNTITHHSVCESIFVSQEWIEALHFKNASRYEPTDFRTTSSSQVSYCFLINQLYCQSKIRAIGSKDSLALPRAIF